jgi:nucleotide-binding universal stress UspA family protein
MMTGFERVLCPVDESEFSARALRYAVALADVYRSQLTILNVRPLLLPPALWLEYPVAPLLEPVDLNAEEERLWAFVRDAAGPTLATVTIREGSIGPEILRTARSLTADLIVMGTHGRSGFEHSLLGSVAENVLRHAPCPVLTVPRRAQEPTVVPFKNILCAIDFSHDSQHALELSRSLAQAAAGRLVLVHSLEQFSGMESKVTAHFNVSEFRRTFEREAKQRLEALVPANARTGCEVSVLVVHGRASREVLRVAAAYEADLIVLGVHGRNVVDLTLFGSTTQHVLHRAEIPVLTVPRKAMTAAAAAQPDRRRSEMGEAYVHQDSRGD